MNQNHKIVRLAKPVKTGLLRLLFSRLPIILALVLLQVFIIVAGYHWLQDYLPYFAVTQSLFTAAMIVYLINSRMDSSAKLTWMWIISLFPVPGAIFLFFTRMGFGSRKMKEYVENRIISTQHELEQDPDVLTELENDSSGTDDLCRYLNRGGCYPIYGGTEVCYFPGGEAKFAAVLDELEKAENFIFLEYFIIQEGLMWGKILDILIRKAQAGVDVRVLYDGMCELKQLPSGYWKRLEKVGIRAKVFSPIAPVISSYYNYRDHRKILVIDGKVAFNGGVNLADEYINEVEYYGHWKDAALMLRGPAVSSFTLLFLQMWNLDSKTPNYSACHAPAEKTASAGYVIPFGDSPMDDNKIGEAVYMDILNRAADYVHIMTPYLILDGELETSLKFAAQRGVDVRVILPGIPDKKAAYALAKTHYRALHEAGVKLYEYTPGFVHAKVFISDDQKAVVGTINLDYRSLYHHYECATYLYRTDCIADIERDFQETLAKCRRVTDESIRNEPLLTKMTGVLMKFIAPLM